MNAGAARSSGALILGRVSVNLNAAMTQLINAVYQHGILKPLTPLRLSEKEKVCLMVTPIAEWKKELGALLRSVHKRTSKFSSKEVESDITKAMRSVRQKTK